MYGLANQAIRDMICVNHGEEVWARVRLAAAVEVEQLATRDALTGVGNRLLFKRELAAELKGHQAIGQSLALWLLDVDHFKRFNDSHGHWAGDLCLRAVTQRLVGLVGRRIVEGFASTPLLLEDTALIGQADGALYEAKRSGRSRFVCGSLMGR
jgi:PleD family two-component response regulator